jgi:hypothetical protein
VFLLLQHLGSILILDIVPKNQGTSELLKLLFSLFYYINCSKRFPCDISHMHILHFVKIHSLYYSYCLFPLKQF